MLKSSPVFDWQEFNDDVDVKLGDIDNTDGGWPSLMIAESRSGQRDHLSGTLIVLFVALCFLATLLWQRAENRLLALESDLQTLHERVSESNVNALTATDSTANKQDIDKVGQLATLATLETDFFRFEVSDDDRAIITAVAAYSDTMVRDLYDDLRITPSVNPDEKMIVRLASTVRGRSGWTIEPYGEFLLGRPSQRDMTEKSVVEIVDSLNTELLNQLLRQWLEQEVQTNETAPQWDAMLADLDNYFWKNQVLDPNWPRNTYFIDRRYFAQHRLLSKALSSALPESQYEEWYSSSAEVVNYVTDPLSEFIIVVYGYTYLPDLTAGFSQYQDWETLVPAVFGLSALEFENQWHDYLEENYPRAERDR